ncbi:MAG: CAP domain-containing protein, partial [Anaerolineae bacterium]
RPINVPTKGPVDAPLAVALVPPVSTEQSAKQPAYGGCGGINAPVVSAAYEQELIERVNAIRDTHGLSPLKWVPELNNSARYHATDLGQDNYFDHDSYDRQGGSLVYVCEWSSRIQSYYSNWLSMGENIAAGYGTPESVMNAWMDSPGHRSNILGGSYWEIGTGFYQGSGDYSRYWVQNFGRRWDIYPLVINREAATTDSPDVSLYMYGDWDEVRLRNDDGSWTGWQPFQGTMNWRLHWSEGERTVWAEMRAGSSTVVSSDTIYLTTGSPSLGDLPDSLGFTYSMDEGRLVPPSYELRPRNVGSDDALSWATSADGTWFTLDPVDGTTPGSFSITPTTFDTGNPGTYSGSATVTVLEPAGTEGSPHQIDLSLQVIEGPFFYSYLPLISR